jgi:membrane-bound lytic murein transglycosylase B
MPLTVGPGRGGHRYPATASAVLTGVLALTWLAASPSAAVHLRAARAAAVAGSPSTTVTWAAPGDSPSPAPLSGQVADARAAAQATAHRVDALRVQYVQLSRRAAAAAERLSAAFAEQARLSAEHDAHVTALAHAETVRTASIRAVYAGGGQLGLLGSVLAAGSADDALWRLGAARRLESGVFSADRRAADAAGAREHLSQQAFDAATRTDTKLARALAGFQEDTAAAEAALNRAEAELNRLNENARRLATAQEAARRLAAARAAAQAARLAPATAVTALGIPPTFLAAYRSAARTCPGMDWALLAAVGQIESGHGRNNGPSSAGAIGPMQFMPATFAAFAVDGDHDGAADAWDYHDAIYTAAAYLCGSGARGGAPDGIRAALFAYNHAQWYVDLVLAARAAIAASDPD